MRIVCFGDSNTYGYDPRSYLGDRYDGKDRWVDLLAEYTGWECICAGVNGREIPRSISKSCFFTDADLFLVMLGTNDLLQGSSAADAAQRMEAFLTQLLPHYPKIILVTPPPLKRGVWVQSDELITESQLLGDAYQQVARKLQIGFVDTRPWNIDLAFDGVHFSEQGHHTFANCLLEHIREKEVNTP